MHGGAVFPVSSRGPYIHSHVVVSGPGSWLGWCGPAQPGPGFPVSSGLVPVGSPAAASARRLPGLGMGWWPCVIRASWLAEAGGRLVGTHCTVGGIQWEGSGKQNFIRNRESILCAGWCEQEEVLPAGSALAGGE